MAPCCQTGNFIFMERIKVIQKNLRDAIKQSGMMQKDIAKQINVAPETISKYMVLDVYPSIDTFANLCIVLDVSADEILGLK